MLAPTLSESEKSFFGVGCGLQGVPVDVIAIHALAGAANVALLTTGKFLEFNGVSQDEAIHAESALVDVLRRLDTAYGSTSRVISCSDFMGTELYAKTFSSVCERVRSVPELEAQVAATVPDSKRACRSSREYPLHEIACVEYLVAEGFATKVGPSQEEQYDKIMRSLGTKIGFAYLVDAYALATRNPERVVHYAPHSRGISNGQRILFVDDERKVRQKLLQSREDALRYFGMLAGVAGALLGKQPLSTGELSEMPSRVLKREVVGLVLENIVQPYQEVCR